MGRLGSIFSEGNPSLFNYNNYRKTLVKLLDVTPESSEFFNALPCFDLRPLGWLKQAEWLQCFNRVCPQLKNVSVLDVSGIGNRIGFYKIRFPELPVIKRAIKISRSIGKITGELGALIQLKAKNRTFPLCLFCIHAVAQVSKKLKVLHCGNAALTKDDLAKILVDCPTITDIYMQNESFASREVQSRFPHVKFHYS